MKKTNIATFAFSLLLGQAFAQEREFPEDDLATCLHNEKKRQIIEKGILSASEVENLESWGDQIMRAFKEACDKDDEETIKRCQHELDGYLTRWTCLKQQLAQN